MGLEGIGNSTLWTRMITTLLGELQAITWFLQKGKAVQILNWRESNLPLEKKHWTVAYLTPSNTSVALLGFSGTHLESSNAICQTSFRFPSYVRLYALCKETWEAPFVLLVFFVNLRTLQLHPLCYRGDLRAENSIIQVGVNSITTSWLMPYTSENIKRNEGCRSSVWINGRKKERTGIHGPSALENMPDLKQQ